VLIGLHAHYIGFCGNALHLLRRVVYLDADIGCARRNRREIRRFVMVHADEVHVAVRHIDRKVAAAIHFGTSRFLHPLAE
jgi:hypothetical protein